MWLEETNGFFFLAFSERENQSFRLVRWFPQHAQWSRQWVFIHLISITSIMKLLISHYSFQRCFTLHLNLNDDLSIAKPNHLCSTPLLSWVRRPPALRDDSWLFRSSRHTSQSLCFFFFFYVIQRSTYEYRGVVPNKYWHNMFVAVLSFKRWDE